MVWEKQSNAALSRAAVLRSWQKSSNVKNFSWSPAFDCDTHKYTRDAAIANSCCSPEDGDNVHLPGENINSMHNRSPTDNAAFHCSRQDTHKHKHARTHSEKQAGANTLLSSSLEGWNLRRQFWIVPCGRAQLVAAWWKRPVMWCNCRKTKIRLM